MRVIIAGSRTINDIQHVIRAVEKSRLGITTVVSGGALGADRLGEMYAELHGIPVVVYKANWDRYGKSAGPVRNKRMAENADALILVWDGKSKGSANMKMNAQKLGLKIYEEIVDEKSN